MKKILLNKSWTMQKENTDKLYNVEVPGSVYSHLIDIGEMKNPDIVFKNAIGGTHFLSKPHQASLSEPNRRRIIPSRPFPFLAASSASWASCA